MKVLVIGDLHGQKPKIHFKNFDCIIQVGDVCDDSEFRPYVNSWFNYLKENPKDKISLSLFMSKLLKKPEIKKMENKSVLKGRAILKFLSDFGKPVFFVPGNWDESYGKTKVKNPDKNHYNYLKSFYDFWLGKKSNPKLVKGLKNVFDLQYNSHFFNNFNFIGYGLVSAPEDYKRKSKILNGYNKKSKSLLKKTYEKIISQLDSAFEKRDKKYPIVFISHNIPYKTKLDIVKNKTSYAHKKHLGSSIARQFCVKYKPLLCIGGHIHEYFGKDKIGKTIVLNAGFGKNANILIDLDEKSGKIQKIKFYKNYKKKKD